MKPSSFLFAVLALATAGCGGGGASNGPLPQATVRRHNGADSFQYSVVGTYSQTGTTRGVATNGVASDVWSVDTFNSLPAEQDLVTTNLNLLSGPMTFTDTVQYNSGWAAIGQSDQGVTQVVTTEGLALPGTLSPTTTMNSTEILQNGVQVSVQMNVIGYGMATTPAGTFNCWTIRQTKTWSDGLVVAETSYFAPELGVAAKRLVTDTYSNGYSDSLTWTLTSDSLGLSPQ